MILWRCWSRSFAGGLRFSAEYAPLPKLNGYGAELNQVFMHLLRNAVQAIDGPGTVRLSATADDQAIHISVTDSGRGITSAQRDAIFNPAFNRNGSRVRASLSLFGCLNTVRKHGGEIEVNSVLGEGSTFTVVLPRSLENGPEPMRAA